MKSILLFILAFTIFSGLKAQTDYYLDFQAGNTVVTPTPFTAINNIPQLTIEAEITFDSITSWTHILSKVIGPTDRLSVQYHQGKIYCIVANGANSYRYTTNNVITMGVKYHIAMTYNGSQTNKIVLYLNGVQQNLTQASTSLPTTTPTNQAVFKVGDSKFKGQIDEVRVWNTALSSANINSWKDTTLSLSHPKINNLVLYWGFNDYTTPDTAFASLNTSLNGIITGAIYKNDSNTYVPPIDTLIAPDTIVGGYLPYYKISKVTPEIFDYLTHVYYFSLGPDAAGNLGRINSTGVFTAASSISTLQPDIDTLMKWKGQKTTKIFLVIGGWVQSDYFDEACANASSRANLVANIKSFCLINNFDGVDLDWEGYHGAVNDTQYGLLINELKVAFTGTNLQIAATINPNHTSLVNAFLNADIVQLMSYGPTISQNTQVTLSKLQSWVDGWTSAGMSKSKLVIGLPFFARNTVNGSSLTYRDILTKYNPSISVDYVNHNGVNYYFNGVNTIKQKTQYALDSNLRGVMIWELGQDTFVTHPKSLLRAINDIIPVDTDTTTLPSDTTYINNISSSSLFKMYPNPVVDELTIEFKTNKLTNITLDLVNMQGQQLLSIQERYSEGIHSISINLSKFSEGIYCIRISDGTNVMTKIITKL